MVEILTLIPSSRDPAKLAQKTADQWASVRAQQRQKLYESDWTREPKVPDGTGGPCAA